MILRDIISSTRIEQIERLNRKMVTEKSSDVEIVGGKTTEPAKLTGGEDL